MSARDDYPALAGVALHGTAPETPNFGELECFRALNEIDALRQAVLELFGWLKEFDPDYPPEPSVYIANPEVGKAANQSVTTTAVSP